MSVYTSAHTLYDAADVSFLCREWKATKEAVKYVKGLICLSVEIPRCQKHTNVLFGRVRLYFSDGVKGQFAPTSDGSLLRAAYGTTPCGPCVFTDWTKPFSSFSGGGGEVLKFAHLVSPSEAEDVSRGASLITRHQLMRRVFAHRRRDRERPLVPQPHDWPL